MSKQVNHGINYLIRICLDNHENETYRKMLRELTKYYLNKKFYTVIRNYASGTSDSTCLYS